MDLERSTGKWPRPLGGRRGGVEEVRCGMGTFGRSGCHIGGFPGTIVTRGQGLAHFKCKIIGNLGGVCDHRRGGALHGVRPAFGSRIAA